MLNGAELRMLGFEQELRLHSGQQARNLPDNSNQKCNICVKGIPPNMSQSQLEHHFSEKYGPIMSVKIAKDAKSGENRGYGFVWFKNAEDATQAMLDYKGGYDKFKLEWYKAKIERTTVAPRFQK